MSYREQLLLLVLLAWLAMLGLIIWRSGFSLLNPLVYTGPVAIISAIYTFRLTLSDKTIWKRPFEPGQITALPEGRLANLFLFPLWLFTLGLTWWMMTLPGETFFRVGAFYLLGVIAVGSAIGVEYVAREKRLWFEFFFNTPQDARGLLKTLAPGYFIGFSFITVMLIKEQFLLSPFLLSLSTLTTIVVVAIYVWVAAVAEEMIFGGTLLPTALDKVDDILRYLLGRTPPSFAVASIAIIIDATAFSLFHLIIYGFDIQALMMPLIFRLFMDSMILHTRSFLTGVVGHMHFNLATLIIYGI